MKLIIDIDDKVYGLLKYFEKGLRLDDKKDDDVKTVLMREVLNGTPLDNLTADIELLKADGLANMDAVLRVIDKYRGEVSE